MHLLWLGMKIFGLTIAVFVVGFTINAVKDWGLHRWMARQRIKQAGTEGWCRYLDYLVHREPRRRTVMQRNPTRGVLIALVTILGLVALGVLKLFGAL